MRHIMALQQPFNWPLLKFPARPNQASCSIGAEPVPESHGGIVGFSAALTAQLTVAPASARLMQLCLYQPNPPLRTYLLIHQEQSKAFVQGSLSISYQRPRYGLTKKSETL